MSDSHNHSHASSEKRLSWAIGLTGIFMIVEVAGGIISGSLALLADAAHMLTDMSSLLLAWIAARIAKKPADKLRSYGYHRVQILAAFINGASFFVIVIWIGYEATQRLLQPRDIMGGVMLIIAFTGLVVNIIVFYILHGGDQKDLNLRGALIHVIGDLLGSIAAIVSAGVIMVTTWTPIDPLLSILVAILILRSAWFVVRHSTHILLEGTPEDVDVRQIRETLTQVIPEVLDVHHVHVWSLTPDRPILTAHIRVSEAASYDKVLRQIKTIMTERFDIQHSTIQIEYENCMD